MTSANSSLRAASSPGEPAPQRIEPMRIAVGWPGRSVDTTDSVRIGRKRHGTADRRPRGQRPRCHPLRDRIIDDDGQTPCNLFLRLSRGHLAVGHGSSASCSTSPPPSNGLPNSTSFTIRQCSLRYRWRFTRLSPTPVLLTLHHAPTPPEVALWSRYSEAPFVAISAAQKQLLPGLNVVGTIHHAVDTATFVLHPQPEDYLVFLGRFTEGKGVLQAIDVARRTGLRLVLAAAANDYYRHVIAPMVDGRQVRPTPAR